MTIRCPECQFALLNTPSILVRVLKSHRIPIPIKVCRRCKIIILDSVQKTDWKVWKIKEYLEFAD